MRRILIPALITLSSCGSEPTDTKNLIPRNCNSEEISQILVTKALVNAIHDTAELQPNITWHDKTIEVINDSIINHDILCASLADPNLPEGAGGYYDPNTDKIVLYGISTNPDLAPGQCWYSSVNGDLVKYMRNRDFSLFYGANSEHEIDDLLCDARIAGAVEVLVHEAHHKASGSSHNPQIDKTREALAKALADDEDSEVIDALQKKLDELEREPTYQAGRKYSDKTFDYMNSYPSEFTLDDDECEIDTSDAKEKAYEKIHVLRFDIDDACYHDDGYLELGILSRDCDEYAFTLESDLQNFADAHYWNYIELYRSACVNNIIVNGWGLARANFPEEIQTQVDEELRLWAIPVMTNPDDLICDPDLSDPSTWNVDDLSGPCPE